MHPIEKNNNNSDINTTVRVEKLKLLFEQSFPAIFMSLVTALIFMAVLWPAQDHSVLLIWLSVLVITAMGRLTLFLRYRKVSIKNKDVLVWERPYFITLMITTLTWGIGSILIMPIDSPIHQVVVLCFMVGLSGSAISIYSAYSLMAIAASATILLPIIIWFFSRGDAFSFWLGISSGLFFALIMRASRTVSSSLHTNLVLKHELLNSKERYERLVEDIGTRYAIISQETISGKFLFVSNGFDTIFGISREQALNQPWHTLIKWKQEYLENAKQQFAMLIEGQIDFCRIPMVFTHPNGEQRTVKLSIHSVKNGSEKIHILEGIVEDITDDEIAKEKLGLAAKVFSESRNVIIITDASGQIIDVNPYCLKITGYSRDELIGKYPKIFKSGKHTDDFYAELWRSLGKTGQWTGEIWNRKKTGEIYSEQLSINATYDENGKLIHYVGTYHDISYLKEREEELEKIAFHDALTGLPNRLVLYDRIKQSILKSNRSKMKFSICYLDLDGFKPVNDMYGHHAGDLVLMKVASRFLNLVRKNDTVARLGGDEFVILLQDTSDLNELKIFLERILNSISKPIDLPVSSVTVSVSIGVSVQQDDCDAEQLLHQADLAMYAAKKEGKNQYRFYNQII